MPRFLHSRQYLVVTLLLVVMCAVFYTRAAAEYVPSNPVLAVVPREFPGWRTIQESDVEPSVQAVLKADATLNRTYSDGGSSVANLFVAFYRTQRAGVSPHSPRVCLPAAGWMPLKTGVVNIPLQGRAPVGATRYILSHGENKSLVLYWFETPHRSVATEYAARFYLIADGLRYHRSDTALVRVIVPVVNDNIDAAMSTAVSFVQLVYDPLKSVLTI